jgi:hypothetical protein
LQGNFRRIAKLPDDIVINGDRFLISVAKPQHDGLENQRQRRPVFKGSSMASRNCAGVSSKRLGFRISFEHATGIVSL